MLENSGRLWPSDPCRGYLHLRSTLFQNMIATADRKFEYSSPPNNAMIHAPTSHTHARLIPPKRYVMPGLPLPLLLALPAAACCLPTPHKQFMHGACDTCDGWNVKPCGINTLPCGGGGGTGGGGGGGTSCGMNMPDNTDQIMFASHSTGLGA